MKNRQLTLEEWRDNSMSNNTLRFRYEFEGFDWREIRNFSDETIRLAAKLADSLERDLKGF